MEETILYFIVVNMINLSYIKLKGKVIDNYLSSLKGWKNKDVEWKNVKYVLKDSSVQFSPYKFRNGVKKKSNSIRDKQDCVVVDYDDGLSISDFQVIYGDYQFVLGTTKSNQKLKQGLVCDRYRVVFKAINIPTDDDVYFRTMELIFPDNDLQTLTLTGAFLGNDDAIIIYNDGEILDLHKASLIAEEQIANEKVDSNPLKKMLYTSYGSSNLEAIKDSIDFEVMVEIIESLGIEVVGSKCSLRDERTMSCKIYDSSYYDFGSGDSGDIFKLIMDRENVSFREAINFVRNFV